jgi:hypothetical protein
MLDAFDGWEAQSLSLSADGRWLLSSGANGIAAVWDLLFFDRFIAATWSSNSPETHHPCRFDKRCPPMGQDAAHRQARR